jgi:hypothetical protein
MNPPSYAFDCTHIQDKQNKACIFCFTTSIVVITFITVVDVRPVCDDLSGTLVSSGSRTLEVRESQRLVDFEKPGGNATGKAAAKSEQLFGVTPASWLRCPTT